MKNMEIQEPRGAPLPPGSKLYFSILGPISAWNEGRELNLSTRRSRVTLGHLIVELGRYVRAEYLLSCLYGDNMPKSAMNQLHRGISELRSQGAPIETKQRSYKLTSLPSSVDSYHFSILCDSAQHAMKDRRPSEAVDLYYEALSLWRGSALSDLESDQMKLYSDFWNERRLGAQESCIDAELSCGHHRSIIPKIRILQAKHPLRERLSGQLMIALYRSGRISESLEVYTNLKKLLRDSLGVDPSSPTEDIHLRILRQDPGIEFP